MKTLLAVLGFSMLLISCQADTDLQETEALTSADSRYIAKDKDKEAETGSTDEKEEEATAEESCETLFARGKDDQSECFLDSDYSFNRWGWTIGPLSEGDCTFELYAGAGQCDTDKGTLVGYLKISYSEGTATVKYEMLEGYTLNETHLYIGNEPYPTDKNDNVTVAPGQYPYKHALEGASADEYSVSGLSGDIYVIAHGVSCTGDGDDNGNTTGGNEEDNPNYTPS